MNGDRIHIPTPCTADWGAMTGDKQRRFCGQCNKHVHNLSAMTPAAAGQVLADKEVCVRARLDTDGTVLHEPQRRSRPLARAIAFGAALLGASPAFAAPQATIPEAQSEPTLMDWVREQIRSVVEESTELVISQGEVRMGDVAPPPEIKPALPPPIERMGRRVPVETRPVVPVEPAPPVAPVPPVAPLPRPEPGESVIPEVEEALRNEG